MNKSRIDLPNEESMLVYSNRYVGSYKRGSYVSKIMHTSSSHIVALHYFHKMSSCRIGDEKWTSHEPNENIEFWRRTIVDAAFYKGKLYAFNLSGRFVNIDVETSTITWLNLSTGAIGMHEAQYLLATPNGELILVLQYWDYETDKENGTTVGFKVMKLDEEKMVWVRVEDLGNRALLVSRACSLCVDTEKECAELEGNCIYFADKLNDKRVHNVDAKVFRMNDNSVEKCDEFPLFLYLFHPGAMF